MATLHEIGERAQWRCWLCDEPVDPEASVNADRGPSVDSFGVSGKGSPGKGSSGKGSKGRKAATGEERLAHRACNTRKGAVAPVVPWGKDLFVVDPAPIMSTVERLSRNGGREVVARCPSRTDAEQAGAWLVDRLSRLAPELDVATQVEAGGGQFVLVLRAG